MNTIPDFDLTKYGFTLSETDNESFALWKCEDKKWSDNSHFEVFIETNQFKGKRRPFEYVITLEDRRTKDGLILNKILWHVNFDTKEDLDFLMERSFNNHFDLSISN